MRKGSQKRDCINGASMRPMLYFRAITFIHLFSGADKNIFK